MVKLLQKSLREYRGVSILTPILVSLEVVMECIIPFITARLVNEIKAGCSIDEILRIGGLLVLMAALSLLFGSLAGLTSVSYTHLRKPAAGAGADSLAEKHTAF